MAKTKRPKLTERQKLCLLMIGDHGLIGTFSEFSKFETRRTIHQLNKRQLVQWIEGRWILTREGHAEWALLVAEFANRRTA